MTTPIAQGPCGLPGSAELDDDDDAAFAEDEKARIAALHKTAPEVIWLQIDDEAEQFDGWEAQTWCSDKINETDVEYVRADTVARLREVLQEAIDGMGGSYAIWSPKARAALTPNVKVSGPEAALSPEGRARLPGSTPATNGERKP